MKTQPDLPYFDSARAIRSFPALAAEIRNVHQTQSANLVQPLQPERFVQAYTIRSYPQPQEEASAASHVVHHILDRMRRLASAYSEWQNFEPSAYFDLNQAQCAQLVQLEERVSTVHCTFYVDPLLPSFRNLANYFEQSFRPGYEQRHHTLEIAEHFFGVVQPAFLEQWLRTQRVLIQIRSQLAMDIGFLAMNNAEAERWRFRECWESAAAPALDERLIPPLRMIPSLTLSHEFPLPAYRQPGRKRRLWFNRERRRLFGRRNYR